MKRVGYLLAAMVGSYIIYTAAFSATVRYKLMIEVALDGVPKSGSGVIEVTYSKNNDPISTAQFSVDVRGEAVIVDLGPRGKLFALLKQGADSRSGPEYILFRAFNFPGGAMPSPVNRGLSQLKQLSGTVDLPLTSLPLLVRFRDINDPMTVERVDPLDISKGFGDGARLVRASLEIVPVGFWPLNSLGITGEPITTGIEGKLPWWNGPFPWLRPMAGGVFVDTRTEMFEVNKQDFKYPSMPQR
jgi:hypothetical protein